ncbi:MAG: hypothetical protein ACXWC9_10610 [Pseudobdellovibrionaceae bacterium]
MKNLILVALVAFVSWQALAVGDCNKKLGGKLVADAENTWGDSFLPRNAKATARPAVKLPVRSGSTDSVHR